MTTEQKPVYNGIPDDIRKAVTDLYEDFGRRPFYARDSEEFERYAELGILGRTPGYTPNSPVEYRFTFEAIRDIKSLHELQSESEWEQKPYRFNIRRHDHLEFFMPFMKEFVISFRRTAFTHVEFAKFLDALPKYVGSPRNVLYNLFQRGALKRKRGYNNIPNEYTITDNVINHYGD